MSENVNVATEVGVKVELEDTERAKIREPRTKRGNLWSYIPLVLVALSFTLPLLFMVSSSFKPRDAVLGDMTSWRAFLPVGDLSFDNYVGVFDRVPVGRFFLNSIIVTVAIVGLGLIVNSMAGFALSRMSFPGSRVLLVGIVATLIVPFETFAIPMVYLVSNLPRIALYDDGFAIEQGWNNSYEVMIIPFIAKGTGRGGEDRRRRMVPHLPLRDLTPRGSGVRDRCDSHVPRAVELLSVATPGDPG
jgi:ABC-type glycerol-3-phosphate transport system permease component